MDYSYKILDVTKTKIYVQYIPPLVLNSLQPTRVWLSWPSDSETTETELRARVESAAPIEDWEELLDSQDNALPDFSALIEAEPRVITLPVDLVAKSKRRRRDEQSIPATPPVSVSGQTEV